MNRKYFLVVRSGWSKTMLDIREISHMTENYSINNSKSYVYMKNGREIEILDMKEFLNDLKELEDDLNKQDEQF